jgi:hypothetical protein
MTIFKLAVAALVVAGLVVAAVYHIVLLGVLGVLLFTLGFRVSYASAPLRARNKRNRRALKERNKRNRL